MAEAIITAKLRARLDEVDFLYAQLPRALDRAVRATLRERWMGFFREQAAALRRQQEALHSTAREWGFRTRPCYCVELEERLNEVRHAVRSRNAAPNMEDKVQRVLADLRTRLLARLEEAIQLAVRIREHHLAQRLRALCEEERSQQLVPVPSRETS